MVQFQAWNEALKLVTESVIFKDIHGRERTQEEPKFGYEKKNVMVFRDTTNFTQRPSRKNVHHIDMTGHVVHF